MFSNLLHRRASFTQPSLVFVANDYDLDTFEMLGVKTGTGGLTEARAYQIEIPDYEGVYRTFEGGEPAWQGGRVAKNYCGRSTSLSGFDTNDVRTWEASPTMTVLDFETVEVTARYASIGVDIPTAVGESLIVSFEAMNIDGNTNLWVTAGDRYSFDLTDQWQRFSVVFPTAVATQSIRIQDRLPDSFGRFKIRNLMVEYTGAVATVCSEFVPFIGSVSPDWIKVFSNYNGNTVTDRVVTEAVGAPLPEVPTLVHAPQATNQIPYSRDLTQWTAVLEPSVTFNQIGLRGESNGASLVDKDTIDLRYSHTTISTGGAGVDFVIRFFIRQEPMDGDYASIKVATSHANGDRLNYAINKETGAYSIIFDSNNPITYAHSEIVGNEVVFTVGGNTRGASAIFIAVYGALSKDFVNLDVAALGNFTVKNVEFYLDTPGGVVKDLPPLINEAGSPVTRDACALSYDTANHDDTAGTYLIEIEHGADGQMLLSEFLRIIGVSMRLTDGVNLADVASAAGSHKVGITYGGGSMQLTIDGVKSGVASYNGTLLVGALDLFRGSPNVGYVGSIRRYDESSESIVNAWMAE